MKSTLLRNFYTAALLFTSALTFSSCDSSTDNDGPISYSDEGVFILNEGNFGTPNGSVSFYHKGSSQVVNDIFSKSNGEQLLGDVVQSMSLYGERAFIVANNSNKIEVVKHATFESVGVVQDLQQPRYFVALNENKGYVTEWIEYGQPGQVSVIDLKTYAITKRIPVGMMPEQLTLSNGKLYIANSGGNTVSVVNTATDVVENTFKTLDGPSEFVQDKDNHIWILSAGKVAYNDDWSVDYTKTTPGSLSKLNTIANAIEVTYTFPSNQSIPKNLTVNGSGDKLYFNYDGKTYDQAVNATALSLTKVIDRSFYGMEADPETGNIFGSDNNNFSSDGTIYIYDQSGKKLNEFKSGIGPNGFVFN